MTDLDPEHCGRHSWRLRPGPYLGETSALTFLPLPSALSPFPLLLAGTGSQLLVYNVKSGALLNSFHVFEGIRVHGISLCVSDPEEIFFLIAVYGERRVKLFRLQVGAELLSIELELVYRLPGFDHWVLDTLFLKKDDYLVVGLSDNSVVLWDMHGCSVAHRVKSSERCLLYSMRMWGNSIEALHVASGTIYNEITVWKLCSQIVLPSSTFLMEETCNPGTSVLEDIQLHNQHYGAIHLCRLRGHEGSIFRITWSPDGSKLMSVSDDRSARIWVITGQGKYCGDSREMCGYHVIENLTLFGHNARIWDCHLTDSVVITAGEDCTCRVWGMDGTQLLMIREHIGRGIWRCLYDPCSSLLITAGFDSAIKIQLLQSSLFKKASEQNGASSDRKEWSEVFMISAPKVGKQLGQMDSKSEYVRCLRFTHESTLYVATNNGYLHRVELPNPGDVRWSELTCISEEGPIICMDVMVIESSKLSLDAEDLVAVGDGKGNATVVRIINGDATPKVESSFTWAAEKDRQLLGIYWCKSLGHRYLFTTDPRGTVKFWDISNALQFNADNARMNANVSLIAVFTTCFGTRIMCLDASIKEQVLVCGDQRGNLTIFPLSEDLKVADSCETAENIPLLDHFKGAHGISCVTSISIAASNFNQVEICTTGGDGCICYFKYDKSMRILNFTVMKQVKGLSTIQTVLMNSTSEGDLAQVNYALGFTSADFLIWNLKNETKTLQIPCGGWRRPYSYHLGSVPEYQNCFAYLKDHAIHIHRLWVPVHERQLFPLVLHMQFHGREIHSLCFISFGAQKSQNQICNSWIATGCEDGTVRLTRYMPQHIGNWCSSILLGEHVGGSAVRSICFISKIYIIKAVQHCNSYGQQSNHPSSYIKDDQFLLISVGAKRVLTSWLLQNRISDKQEAYLNGGHTGSKLMSSPSTDELSSMSFQWLSTHMPPKFASAYRIEGKIMDITDGGNTLPMPESQRKEKFNSVFLDQSDNDWRYLAVTAFQVKHPDSRSAVCFIVVACSDATLMLRALLLPHRLWFDIAILVPQTSPVLALQHVALPVFSSSKDIVKIEDVHMIISGSTDGSITFWDLSEAVGHFMQFVNELQPEMLIDCQRRPRTGRGSQGGRWLTSNLLSKSGVKNSSSMTIGGVGIHGQNSDKIAVVTSSIQVSDTYNNQASPRSTDSASLVRERSSNVFLFEIHEVRPLCVLNSVHQSGVNCLHVSEVKDCRHSESGITYCVVSGGDDQALQCIAFELGVQTADLFLSHQKPTDISSHEQNGTASSPSESSSFGKCAHAINKYEIRVIYQHKVTSAHSSAVKGIWTDGSWTFSTGLDQRVRCWQIDHVGKLTEHAHIIIGVPEPEALDAITSGRNQYQIAVAGRGMQMVEFCVPSDAN